jgi:hypothetical protein
MQAQAYAAQVSGTMTPAMGRRGLSLAAGMLDDSTVSDMLRLLRDLQGSPLLRIEKGSGQAADRYALVTARIAGEDLQVTEAEIERVRVEPVHAVWGVVLGHAARDVFERLEAAGGRSMRVAELVEASVQSQTQVYAALRRLAEYGLIERGRGWIRRTTRTLDDVADEHHVADAKAERIERFRSERSTWHRLIAMWNAEPADECPDAERIPEDPMPPDEREAWLAAVMATGPPPDDPFALTETGPADVEGDDHQAVALLADMLGARVIDHEPAAALATAS